MGEFNPIFQASQTKTTPAKIVFPKLVKKINPIYPPEAPARNAAGTVRVYYVIGGDGLVYNAHAVSGEGFSDDQLLKEAAEDAVRQWRYLPLTVDGKPAEMDFHADVEFAVKN